ncbi:MAG: cell division protein FtsL [Cypionkella sp.]|nr:cell division protein FtsL [Cypionkella sp.]
MRPMFYIACFLVLIGLGSWAYRENYATQNAMRDLRAMQDEIVQLRGALAVQRAEWAYLNRPDRLRELVTLNFDRLGLLPMDAAQFGAASDVAYPAPDAPLGATPSADDADLQALMADLQTLPAQP